MNDKIRVLIVDDEERFRETTATILKRRGFEVTAVGTGIEAIEEVKKDQIDVVVLDIKMPGMDGNEALREIRKIKPEITVIMLTGHGTPESAIEGISNGVYDYLAKPCAVELLALKIGAAYINRGGVSRKEPKVRNIMIPLSSFSSIREDKTICEAIEVILESFAQSLRTATTHEMVHRSILVLGKRNKVVGIITFTDLLHGLQPQYMRLLNEKPGMADSISVQSPNYSGMFTIMARDIANKTVREIMSDDPPVIDADANLMEAVGKLIDRGLRRLLVVEKGKITGVVREQDLFFEMANAMKQYKSGVY
jgi:DNA-binding response OmpR family regulator